MPERQAERIGKLPPVPGTSAPADRPGDQGLYVGSTLAPSWQDRIAVGDLGFRAKAELTRYRRGSCCSAPAPADLDSRGGDPRDPHRTRSRRQGHDQDGILVIRWQLPTGTEIDTGFRGDDRT